MSYCAGDSPHGPVTSGCDNDVGPLAECPYRLPIAWIHDCCLKDEGRFPPRPGAGQLDLAAGMRGIEFSRVQHQGHPLPAPGFRQMEGACYRGMF